ncbi:MAG TPA: CHASE2 domain-containing protein [Hyphomicrobiaceae bacterium]|nr:CHASE2 domain-containing protein [Hyphomicrobiaceae bacterium]
MTAEPQVQGKRASQPGSTLMRRPLIWSGVFALLATLLLTDLVPRYAPGLLRFEHYLGDVRTALLSDQLPSQHPSVAIVAITDDTLAGYRTYLPVDRDLLARVIEAVDAAGAKVIGLDFLFTSPADGSEILLIEAIRRARAKVVLAAADERIGLSQVQRDKQQAFFREVDRPVGYLNLATERDSVVRFMAQPNAEDKPAYPKSFAALIAESAGFTSSQDRARIAWLRTPRDGADTFLTISAEALLRPADDPVVQVLRAGLKDKIVLVGGTLREIDTHLTPLTNRHEEKMHGVAIHAQMVAQMVDGRSIAQLETEAASLRLALAAVAALGFLVGWGFRRRRKGLFASGVVSAVIIAVDTIVFWQFRIILPLVLALAAWFLGEFSGHYLGRWLGPRGDRPMWFAR